MATELQIKITADAERADNALSGFKSKLSGLGDIVKTGLGVGAGILGAGVVTGLVDIGKNAIGAGFNFLSMQENAKTAFATMLGDGTKAQELLKNLQTFAASTPFEFPEIAGAAKSLLAFGVGAGDMTVTLQRVGDIASGVGAPLGDIAELYGKAKVQGRLFSQDINQLTGRGIPIIQQLAKQFGVADSEVMKLVESGKVGFPNLEQAFKDLTSTGGQFSGMMDAQSKTFSGMMSTLMDTLNATAGQIMAPLFEIAKTALGGLISFLGSPALQAAIANFSDFLGMAFEGISDALQNGDIIGAIGVFVADILQAFGMGEDAAIEFSHMVEDVLTTIGGLFSGGLGGGGVSQWIDFVAQMVTGLQTAFGGFIGWIVGSLVPAFADAFGQIATAAVPTLGLLGGWLNDTLLPALQSFANFIGPVLGQAFTMLGEFVVKTALPALTQLGVWVWSKGLPMLGDLANKIGGALNSAFATAVDLWGKLSKGFQDAVQFIKDLKAKLDELAAVVSGAITTAFQAFNDKILQPILTTFQGIASFIQDVIDKLTDLANLLGMNVSGLRDAFGAMIPHYAGGTGFARGGMSLVGERGPELVNLPRGAQVIPYGQWSAGGGMTVVIENLTYAPFVSLLDRAEAKEKFGPFLREALAG